MAKCRSTASEQIMVFLKTMISMPGLTRRMRSASDRDTAAKLLVHIRKLLAGHGIVSIYDPRVASDVRRLWHLLLDSDALDALSAKELGLVYRLSMAPKRAALCGTSALGRGFAGCLMPARKRGRMKHDPVPTEITLAEVQNRQGSRSARTLM